LTRLRLALTRPKSRDWAAANDLRRRAATTPSLAEFIVFGVAARNGPMFARRRMRAAQRRL